MIKLYGGTANSLPMQPARHVATRWRRGLLWTASASYILVVIALSSSRANNVLDGRPQDDFMVARPNRVALTQRDKLNMAHDMASWPRFNGTCGTAQGREVRYISAESQVDMASCVGVCKSVLKCRAVTINTATRTCRLARECPLRLHFAVNEITVLLPDDDSPPDVGGNPLKHTAISSRDGYHVDERSAQSSCDDKCPPAGQCAEPFVCHAGQCFRGQERADGTPCDDGDALTSGDVCNSGVCRGSSSPLDGFTMKQDVRCVRHSSALNGVPSHEHCAAECVNLEGECTAFSWRGGECQLFNDPQPRCSLRGHGWVTGTLVDTI